jgi:hypothetical protein
MSKRFLLGTNRSGTTGFYARLLATGDEIFIVGGENK